MKAGLWGGQARALFLHKGAPGDPLSSLATLWQKPEWVGHKELRAPSLERALPRVVVGQHGKSEFTQKRRLSRTHNPQEGLPVSLQGVGANSRNGSCSNWLGMTLL